MNHILLLSAISIFIAVYVIVLGFLNYRMSRKLPNEDKLFEEKIISYQVLIRILNETTTTFIECSNDLKLEKEGRRNTEAVRSALNEVLYESYYKLTDTIYENSLIVPDSILKKIYDYVDLLDQADFLNAMTNGHRLKEFEDKTKEHIDNIVNAMQEDLAFEKLNFGSKKRAGGN